MESFQQTVSTFLEKKFESMTTDFGPVAGTDRISGVLSWEGFADKDFVDRQHVVWKALRARFHKRTARISALITLTPRELEDYAAGEY